MTQPWTGSTKSSRREPTSTWVIPASATTGWSRRSAVAEPQKAAVGLSPAALDFGESIARPTHSRACLSSTAFSSLLAHSRHFVSLALVRHWTLYSAFVFSFSKRPNVELSPPEVFSTWTASAWFSDLECFRRVNKQKASEAAIPACVACAKANGGRRRCGRRRDRLRRR